MTDHDAVLAERTARIAARIRAEAGSALTHATYSEILAPCPHCDEPAGAVCRTSGGWQLIGVHAGRRKAVAKLTLCFTARFLRYALELLKK